MFKGPFCILIPCEGRSFNEQADNLLHQLKLYLENSTYSLDALLQARFYVSDATNQFELLKAHDLYQLLMPSGVVTYIEQPPLCGAKISLLLWFAEGEIEHRVVSSNPYGTVAQVGAQGLDFLVQSVRYSHVDNREDSEYQTKKAFQLHKDYLLEQKMNLKDHCHRTWIYVRDVDRNYAGVVKGRNEVFASEGLTADTHYIASTGIGGASCDSNALVAMDFFSVKGLSDHQIDYLHALEYLNPTHEYGVAFERGTYLDFPDARYYFISGTASIDKNGECVHRGDVMTQAGRLFLNIEKLLESADGTLSDVAYFIVYLRDVSDYSAINAYMHLRFPNTPFLITEARVCRPEWLIEVECIGRKINKKAEK